MMTSEPMSETASATSDQPAPPLPATDETWTCEDRSCVDEEDSPSEEAGYGYGV